jgi:hypothetical protein
METDNAKSLEMDLHTPFRTWAGHHPIAAYIVLTLAWSWSIRSAP